MHSTKGKIVNHKTSSQPREKPALLKDSTIASLKFEFLPPGNYAMFLITSVEQLVCRTYFGDRF